MPSASFLWSRLSSQAREHAAEAFWRTPDFSSEKETAAISISKAMPLRISFISQRLSVSQKSKYLSRLAKIPEDLALALLVAYHLEYKIPMLATFLDKLGIAHVKGLIADPDGLTAPDSSILKNAVLEILQSYDARDAAIYLYTLVAQNKDVWGGIVKILESRPEQSNILS